MKTISPTTHRTRTRSWLGVGGAALVSGATLTLDFQAIAGERAPPGRGAVPSASGSSIASTLAPSPRTRASASAVASTPRAAASTLATAAMPIAAPPIATTPRPGAATPSSVLRGLVDAAWREAKISDDLAIDGLAARARESAALPELRLRVHHGVGIGASLETGEAIADRSFATDSVQTLYEARLTWRLDRLVFADEEVTLERIRLERAELRLRIAARIIDLFVTWLRARQVLGDAGALDVERVQAELVATEAVTALDVFTGGAASRPLSTLGVAAPTSGAQSAPSRSEGPLGAD